MKLSTFSQALRARFRGVRTPLRGSPYLPSPRAPLRGSSSISVRVGRRKVHEASEGGSWQSRRTDIIQPMFARQGRSPTHRRQAACALLCFCTQLLLHTFSFERERLRASLPSSHHVKHSLQWPLCAAGSRATHHLTWRTSSSVKCPRWRRGADGVSSGSKSTKRFSRAPAPAGFV